MKTYQLYWKENKIGEFIEESMDMGYLDGKMISNGIENANQFVKIASKFDAKSVMLNPQNGIRASLKDETNFLINVLVLELTEKMEISFKMIIGKQKTIDWFIQNVPEE